MSDNYLRLIPADVRYIPADDVAAAAVGIASRALPEADVVQAERHEEPVFIDQGTNLEAIICPACRVRMVVFGQDGVIQQWWYELIEPLQGKGVAGVEVRTPCCAATVPFSELEFDWPAGVASFEISIRNPGIGNPLDETVIAQLEAVLGCRVKQVWAHY